MDDITYCTADCGCINCKRNKENISNHRVLHSWCRPEDLPDCPLKKYEKEVSKLYKPTGHNIREFT